MDIDTNGRGIAQIDNSEPPTCECCGDEYTMDAGDEPTPFCDSCAHNVLEKRTAELADLRTTLARLTAEVGSLRGELATVRDELAKCADAVSGYFNDGDSVSDTVQVVADALGHAKAAEHGLTAERDMWRSECESISAELDLPPGIRPAEGELRRMLGHNRALLAERDEARGLLVEVRDVLAICTTRAFTAPEDAEVRALGMRIGFGALMSAASKGWADLLSERYPEAVGAHHTTGPCEATVQCMLAKLARHLWGVDR